MQKSKEVSDFIVFWYIKICCSLLFSRKYPYYHCFVGRNNCNLQEQVLKCEGKSLCRKLIYQHRYYQDSCKNHQSKKSQPQQSKSFQCFKEVYIFKLEINESRSLIVENYQHIHVHLYPLLNFDIKRWFVSLFLVSRTYQESKWLPLQKVCNHIPWNYQRIYQSQDADAFGGQNLISI